MKPLHHLHHLYLPHLLAGLLLASVVSTGAAAASGADVVGGSVKDRTSNGGTVDLTFGAADTTPGDTSRFDGRGSVHWKLVAGGFHIDTRSEVLCVIAEGDIATVVTRITRNDSENPTAQRFTHLAFFVLDGDQSGVPDKFSVGVFINPSDALLQSRCATASTGSAPFQKGNLVVYDGA